LIEFIIDTHILLWWRLDRDRLAPQQLEVLERVTVARPVAISDVTLWELAMAASKGRITLPDSVDLWLSRLERHPAIHVLPITAAIAVRSTQLGSDFQRDPTDRIIVATARIHDLTLITSDKRIRQWGGVRVL